MSINFGRAHRQHTYTNWKRARHNQHSLAVPFTMRVIHFVSHFTLSQIQNSRNENSRFFERKERDSDWVTERDRSVNANANNLLKPKLTTKIFINKNLSIANEVNALFSVCCDRHNHKNSVALMAMHINSAFFRFDFMTMRNERTPERKGVRLEHMFWSKTIWMIKTEQHRCQRLNDDFVNMI